MYKQLVFFDSSVLLENLNSHVGLKIKQSSLGDIVVLWEFKGSEIF